MIHIGHHEHHMAHGWHGRSPGSRATRMAAAMLLAACGDPAAPRPRPVLPRTASADSVMVGDTVRLHVAVRHLDSATAARDVILQGIDGMGAALFVSGQPRTIHAVEPGVQAIVASIGDSLADTVRIVVRERYTAMASAGGWHSCALAVTGVAYCWGDNLFTAGRGDEAAPGSVWGDVSRPRFASIDVGGNHTCAIDPDGGSWCWGRNSEQQLGYATTSDLGASARRTLVPAPTAQVVAGYAHSCALQADRRTLCWGSGIYGASGRSITSSEPREVATSTTFARLGRASWTQCALDTAGRAWCWGRNDLLQLGRATPASLSLAARGDTVPRMAASTVAYRDIGSGADVTCALAVAGFVDCWGHDVLGDGMPMPTADSLPHRVALPAGRYVALAVGFEHACALDDTGGAWCWGRNDSGQLGDGTTTPRLTPVRVASDVRFTTVVAGTRHNCGGATDGRVYCWGENREGQLGTGDQSNHMVPTRLVYQP